MGGVGNGAEAVMRNVGVEEVFVGEVVGTETLLLHRSKKTSILLVGDVDGVNGFAEGDVVEVACH